MSVTVRLGCRVAVGAARGRSAVVAAVMAVAVGLVGYGSVIGAAKAEEFRRMNWTDPTTDPRLRLTVALAVLLPALVLSTSLGRLASGVRDARANAVHVLGLTRRQAAIAVGVEIGIPAAVGAALGTAGCAFIAVVTQTSPAWWFPAVAGAMVLSAAGAAAASVVRGQARGGGLTEAGALRIGWRLTILGVGALWCLGALLRPPGGSPNQLWAVVILAVGVVVSAPVLCLVLARVLITPRAGPGRLLVGRRLAARPAAGNRVVAALLIGVFLAVGARSVVQAFGDDAGDAMAVLEVGDDTRATTTPAAVEQVSRAIRDTDDIAKVSAPVPVVAVAPSTALSSGQVGVLGTCADLERLVGAVRNCESGRVQKIAKAYSTLPPTVGLAESRGHSTGPWTVRALPVAQQQIITSTSADADPDLDELNYLIPTSAAPAAMLAKTDRALRVRTEPGTFLDEGIYLPGYDVKWTWKSTQRQAMLVLGVNSLAWALGGIVLAIILISLGTGVLDRALERRREVGFLRTLGVDQRILSRTQWWEAFLPAAVGVLVAAPAGVLAAAVYLHYASDRDTAVRTSVLRVLQDGVLIGGLCLAVAAGLAGCSVLVGSSGRRAQPRTG